MADTHTVVHMGENSPEQVAFKLMGIVASAEGKNIAPSRGAEVDRKWLLDAYAECLYAVRGYRDWTK